MKKQAKSKTTSAVGLDIGSYSVKCVEVVQTPETIELRRVSILPTGKSPSATVAAVLKTVSDSAASNPPEHVRISVSGTSLLIRRIQLPIMTPAELKGAIVFEAESHIPFPIDDCILDFQILDRNPDKKNMNVLLVAAKKDFLQERLKILLDTKIVPEVIDVDIFCLMNAFETFGPAGDQKTYGVLNVGHQVSSFAILQEKQPFFVREIPFGGHGVTKFLAETRGVSEEEADRLKTDRTQLAPADLKTATEKGFEQLIEELKHSIDYFENETGEELRTIWISGGGALSAAAPEILSEELGKQVSLWDNTKKMEISREVDPKSLAGHSPLLNVALGMVSRSREPNAP